MRLTTLCICGTLLAFSSLSWTSAYSGEGDIRGDNAFQPCAATLRPEGLCRQGQDESTCPYLFSLPPLTLHLPKQLTELEEIVKDLQKLKENVDQLRKMCADCTVSQTERECGRQRETGHEKLNEGMDRHKDERNWLNERNPKTPKGFSQECGTDRVKAEKTMDGDGDTDSEKRSILEEKGRKKWEAERESDKVVIKEIQREETLKEVAENDGKTKTEGANRKDKLGQAKVPTAGGNEKILYIVRKKVVEKNNRETDKNKNNNRKGNSKGDPEDMLEYGKERKITSNLKNKTKTEESDHHVWPDDTKETEKNTQIEKDRDSDGIKMSEGHDEHTNHAREQQREERKKEMEKGKGIKVERNNEKPKQTESIGHAEKKKTIKEGEVEDGETGTRIKTEGEKTVQSLQRDSDGELASSKAPERTDFVSINPTTQSIISLAPRQDTMDSNEATTFPSSLPSPLLSSLTLHLITDVNQGMTIVADGLPTKSTGFGAAVISEHPNPDAEEDFRATSSPKTTATINTLGGPGQQVTSATSRFTFTTSPRPGAGFQGRVSSITATTTTTTPRQNLYTTTSPGVADRSSWTAKKNISSNTKTGVKPLAGRRPKPSEKHKPAIKPEADQRLKNPRNDRKPVQAPLPHKKPKLDQKPKPSYPIPTTNQKSKPGKEPKQVQIPKPDQRPLPSHLPPDQNLKNNQIPKHDQEHTADQSQLPIQKTTSQKPQTANPTRSDKDLQTGREPESVEIPITSQNSKLEKKLVNPLKSDKPDQPQKTKPDQRSTINQYFPPVQKPQAEISETTSLTPTPNHKPITGLMQNGDENPLSVNNLTPEEEVTPESTLINPSDQKHKSSQKIPKINPKPKPNQKHPALTTGQKTKPHVKPKPDQTAQPNQGLKTPQPDQIPNLDPKSAPDKIPETESNKKSKPRPPPIRRPPTRPTVSPAVRPGAIPVQRPKPAVQQKPSPKTKADLDSLKTSKTKSEDIQNSQTNMPPASSPVQQIAEVSHSQGDTEFSPITMQTISLGPKTSNSLETGPFPRLHTVSEGFTMSPNSRIASDLRPQTTSRPPSIPMTTSPPKNVRGILPSVISSIIPGSTKPNQATDSRSQAKILHNVEETAPRQTPESDKMKPVPTTSVQTTSNSPDLRSTTPATSGPEPLAAEFATPSARELRVKINQVAAFFNNSLSENGRPPERRRKEHPEDNQGGSRPDSKLPTLITSKVNIASDCSNHLLRGETKSGVYLVTPDLRSKSFPVFCDMELDGGGWTLLQRRKDGSVSFNRTWAEYRSGFGELDGGEFWLGNNMIHLLTRDRDMMLRVELEDFNGVMEYAEYEQFRVASERLRYRLTVGGYSGTAGDALRFSRRYDHNNRAFTTPDRDHDRYPSGNCGAYYSSGWWFDACMAANLNGRYYVGSYRGVRDGIFWGTWQNISNEYYPTNDRQSFKSVTMMIRPKGFTP
ncbi:mucin-5AC-like [Etheostoma cragini]|uniref:mucin-5AC-like n=1 Tax=Etheostoma cragini TaxID=417921 RepID=UPI00155DFFFD|nr:mucin-5AC-like [Etheostoma cragini]